MKWMSNFAVLSARPVRVDGNCCIAHFTACMTVHAQEVPIAIARAIACASSERDMHNPPHSLFCFIVAGQKVVRPWPERPHHFLRLCARSIAYFNHHAVMLETLQHTMSVKGGARRCAT